MTFIACLAAAFTPAASGAVAQPDDWYRQLDKPSLNPPNWVFPVVWTALYASMGLAHYDYTTAETSVNKSTGHGLHALQLLLNATWSPVFFARRSPRLALVNIVCLALTIMLTMRAFARVSKRAAWLLLPYLCWVGFATYLNGGIVRLNDV